MVDDVHISTSFIICVSIFLLVSKICKEKLNCSNLLIQLILIYVYLVIDKPVFPADAAKQYDITEFQQGSINLTASGNPGKLKYTWFRHSQKIIPGSRRRRDIEISHFKQDGGVLEIENITREDTGTYIIMASNTEGSTNHTIVINVQCKLTGVLTPASLEYFN